MDILDGARRDAPEMRRRRPTRDTRDARTPDTCTCALGHVALDVKPERHPYGMRRILEPAERTPEALSESPRPLRLEAHESGTALVTEPEDPYDAPLATHLQEVLRGTAATTTRTLPSCPPPTPRHIHRGVRGRAQDFLAPVLTLGERLGAGSFGTVWKAEMSSRVVAVKRVINRNLQNRREEVLMRMLSSPGHPNVVRLLDAYAALTEIYLVLEFVPVPLDERLRLLAQNDMKLTPEWCVTVLSQLAQGLEYVHRHSIVHRDVKPANICINPRSRELKLIDFGSAKLLEGQPNSTTICTPWYAVALISS